MVKEDIVSYLAGLSFIMDMHEKLGTTKNPLLTAEFERGHKNLIETLQKEKEDEARNRKDNDERREDRPRSGQSIRDGSEPDRRGGGVSSSDPVRREGRDGTES